MNKRHYVNGNEAAVAHTELDTQGKEVRDISAIIKGGYCTRWHANADMAHIRETLAEHHARVAQILLSIHPSPSLKLIDAALHHDAGEPAVGDVPWPVKRDNSELSEMLEIVEAKERERIGCSVQLSSDETVWLKLADRLAGVAHVLHTNPMLMKRADWVSDLRHVEEVATSLGCLSKVSTLINMTQASQGDRA